MGFEEFLWATNNDVIAVEIGSVFIECVLLNTGICTGKSPISVRMGLQLQSVRICPGFSVRIAYRL